MEFTTDLMNIKVSEPILKYGHFQMVKFDDDYVIFRRKLNNESLLCIVNRDKRKRDIEIETKAENVELIYGECSIELNSGNLILKDLADNFGFIIKET